MSVSSLLVVCSFFLEIVHLECKAVKMHRNIWGCASDIIKYCGKDRDPHASISNCLDLHHHMLTRTCRDRINIHVVNIPPECTSELETRCARLGPSLEGLSCLHNSVGLSQSCARALPARTHFEELPRELKLMHVDGECSNHIIMVCGDIFSLHAFFSSE